jgi:hypothetical protein
VQLTSNHVKKASLAAMVVGAGLIVAALLSMWLGGSSDDDALTGQDALSRSQGLQPFDTGLTETKDPSRSAKAKDGLSALTAGAGNPFGASSGDNKAHKVEIRFSSDGAFYAGWRYRTKGGEGLKVGDRSLVVGKTVRGGLPVAQVAVQALRTATYATCSIVVDGVVVATETAKGANHVTVCVG